MAVIISSDLVLAAQAGEVLPLTHARICYQDFAADATVTASSEVAGFEGDSTQDPTTYEYWKPSSLPATLTFDFGELKTFDYVMIAVHSLGSNGCAFIPQYYHVDDEVWTDLVSERIPSDDSTIIALFDEVTAQRVRINITSGDDEPVVGVVYVGQALAMQRPIYQGHSPINLSRQTVTRPSRSDGGQWLGSSIIRRGLSTSFDWKNLRAQWYRDNFDPFVAHARTLPFGIAWRPSSFPNECAYCWAQGDIQPTNSGPLDYMSVSLQVTATEY